MEGFFFVVHFASFQKGCNRYAFVKNESEGIYNLLSVVFNRFYNILFLGIAVYRLPDGGSDEVSGRSLDCCDSGSETILYLASNQAPKSISLHRCEQKGKNFVFGGCS